MTLGSYMLVAGGKAETKEDAELILKEVIADGSALDKLAEFVEAQGGDRELVYHPERLPQASIAQEIGSLADGYIQEIVCDEIGICSLILGGGRETKESEIDLSVGLVLHKKVGDAVRKGESLATIYANDQAKLDAAADRFLQAYTIDGSLVEKKPLIKGIVME